MKKLLPILLVPVFLLLAPIFADAQVSNGVSTLNTVLNNVYNQMIPLCSDLISIAQAVCGLGTTFYIGFRVWKHIAKAEPIDFFPLFRPFVIVLCIGIYPSILDLINGVLDPTVTGTAAIVQHSNDAVNALLLLQERQAFDTTSVLIAPNPQASQQGWDKYTQPGATTTDSGGGFWSAIGSGFKFIAGGIEASLRYVFKFLLSIILEVLYYAAALCIDTIRVFHLIVLAMLGPFAFAFSCYDGFHQSLTHWLGRYINIYLWLPIANILGAILGLIQQNMLQIDLTRVQNGDISLFSATDFAYLIFMIIGVVGYTTIPGLANYIVHVHGPNPLAEKVSKLAGTAVKAAVSGGAGAAGGASGAGAGASGSASGGGSASAGATAANQYSRDKIAG